MFVSPCVCSVSQRWSGQESGRADALLNKTSFLYFNVNLPDQATQSLDTAGSGQVKAHSDWPADLPASAHKVKLTERMSNQRNKQWSNTQGLTVNKLQSEREVIPSISRATNQDKTLTSAEENTVSSDWANPTETAKCDGGNIPREEATRSEQDSSVLNRPITLCKLITQD